jgi:hypothetical protein
MRLCAILLAVVLVGPADGAGVAAGTSSRDDLRRALAVLHRWDDRRAGAWAASDEGGLRALYVRGSTAARNDVRLLRSYTARGVVVRRVVTQVFGLRVVRTTQSRLVVRVLDRVAGGEVVIAGGVLPLPSSQPVVRRIVLVLTAGGWKVRSVTGWG